MNGHYDAKYFDWQKKSGEFGGKAELFKFQKYIFKEASVIDFGSGGGYLLKNLICKEKIGIEINDSAREIAFKNGVTSVSNIDEISFEFADVIVSNHALEHCENPLEILRKLSTKIKVGGKIIIVTPYEIKSPFKFNDINQHLFTWSPMNAGNLITKAGFNVIEAQVLFNKWPPKSEFFYKLLGDKAFQILSKIYGFLYPYISKIAFYQTIVVAEK